MQDLVVVHTAAESQVVVVTHVSLKVWALHTDPMPDLTLFKAFPLKINSLESNGHTWLIKL